MALPIPADLLYEHLSNPFSLGRAALVRKYRPHYSAAEIDNFLSQKRSFTSHRESHKRPKNPFFLSRLRQLLEADLIVYAPSVSHPQYILVVVDALSRYVWCEFCTRKNAQHVTEAFDKIFHRLGGQTDCQVLATDSGGEFLNRRFLSYLQRAGIEHREVLTTMHAVHVERTNRSLRRKLSRF